MIQKTAGILRSNPTANLQTAGVSLKSPYGSLPITGTKLDYVPAFQSVTAIQVGKPRCILGGCEIGPETPVIVRQGAADNLFDLTVVEINAGPEHLPQLDSNMNASASHHPANQEKGA
jgi:hypothetical protein